MIPRPQVILVDGYAVIYRAFFAMITRPVRTQAGEHTGTAWGVTTFLFRLLETFDPPTLVWVEDAGDSFRTAAFEGYKSTRTKLTGELRADFDRALGQIHTLLDAFGVPLVRVPGYEADDVIGTLALQASAAGRSVAIVSGDKDFLQLVRPGVALLNPGRGGKAGVAEEWIDENNAAERLGVPPAQVTDYLALVGDSSDGVPGVRGVGPKGALALLAAHANLEAVLAAAPNLPAKGLRERLVAHAEMARLSKRLVTIQTEVPGAPHFDELGRRPVVAKQLEGVLEALEFKTLLPRAAKLQAERGAQPG